MEYIVIIGNKWENVTAIEEEDLFDYLKEQLEEELFYYEYIEEEIESFITEIFLEVNVFIKKDDKKIYNYILDEVNYLLRIKKLI